MSILLAFAIASQTVDPYQLDIGTPGKVAIHNNLISSKTGQEVTVDQIAASADKFSYVLVGEQHATPAHHQMQADVIRALHKRGRRVLVGMEMFTRDNQSNLYMLPAQRESVDEFFETSGWKTQWGHDFAAYRPILEAVRELQTPIIALNAPRDWVRRIGREGASSLKPEERAWVPEIRTDNENHKKLFNALMGGHPMTGPQGDNIYAAQVTWDTAMAKSAIDAKNARYGDKTVVVILAGIGHVMYGQAINYRIKQLSGAESLSVVCIRGGEATEVSRGLGDYIYQSP